MRIAFKVDVCTQQGAAEGVPNLLKLLKAYDIKASFFFSTGLDADDFGLRQAWSRALGLFGTVQKDSAATSAALLSDTVLAVMEAGHDVGLGAHDAHAWTKQAAFANADWTRHQLALAAESMQAILGQMPPMFAASGWQLNAHLLVQEDNLGFSFASDTRGKYPFYPSLQSVCSGCPQIPTTLPTLQEMLGWAGVTSENVHEYLYAESRYVLPVGHVYSAQAELEGISQQDIMEKLIVMWKGQEGELRPLSSVYNELDLASLPCHQVGWAGVAGGSRHLATQSVQVVNPDT